MAVKRGSRAFVSWKGAEGGGGWSNSVWGARGLAKETPPFLKGAIVTLQDQ